MIDHLVVSWIEIGGLFVSLYGLLLLSLTFFGQRGPVFLRPIVPVAVATIFFVVTSFAATPLVDPLDLHQVHDLRAKDFSAVYLLVFIVYLYVASLVFMRRENRITRRRLIISVLALLLIGGVIVSYELTTSSSPSAEIVLSGLGAISLGLTLIVYTLTLWWTLRVDDDGLQRLGLILSIAGILTQFLPPVLDIINVKITNP